MTAQVAVECCGAEVTALKLRDGTPYFRTFKDEITKLGTAVRIPTNAVPVEGVDHIADGMRVACPSCASAWTFTEEVVVVLTNRLIAAGRDRVDLARLGRAGTLYGAAE